MDEKQLEVLIGNLIDKTLKQADDLYQPRIDELTNQVLLLQAQLAAAQASANVLVNSMDAPSRTTAAAFLDVISEEPERMPFGEPTRSAFTEEMARIRTLLQAPSS
jgi:hypothetical protein